VEITCFSRGPVVRAEATASDFYTALDAVINKLDTRLRRAADRRRVHRGRHVPVSVAAATAALAFPPDELIGAAVPAFAGSAGGLGHGSELASGRGSAPASPNGWGAPLDGVDDDDDQPWHIVREKEHPADPMTVDDALFHMELLGHDFYLFLDKDSGRPSVVYRRRAYDYGVICLGM
jgi:hypothetical protein